MEVVEVEGVEEVVEMEEEGAEWCRQGWGL